MLTINNKIGFMNFRSYSKFADLCDPALKSDRRVFQAASNSGVNKLSDPVCKYSEFSGRLQPLRESLRAVGRKKPPVPSPPR